MDNSYIRDRGYAFEQKLNSNTRGVLNKKLSDYHQAEEGAAIPFMFFNTAITRDGRKMIISTHPVRFMMQPQKKDNNLSAYDIDGLDFQSFFARQNAGQSAVSYRDAHERYFSFCTAKH